MQSFANDRRDHLSHPDAILRSPDQTDIGIGDHFFHIDDGVVWRVCWLIYSGSARAPQVVLRNLPDNRVCNIVSWSGLNNRQLYQPLSMDEVRHFFDLSSRCP